MKKNMKKKKQKVSSFRNIAKNIFFDVIIADFTTNIGMIYLRNKSLYWSTWGGLND